MEPKEQPTLLDLAALRVDNEPALTCWRDYLLADDGIDHLEWVCDADTDDLLQWAKRIQAQEDAQAEWCEQHRGMR